MSIRPELLTAEQQVLLVSTSYPEYQLYLDIKGFDYYYDYSDDYSVQKTWRNIEEDINDRLKKLDSHYNSSLRAIWKANGEGKIVAFEALNSQVKEQQDYLHVAKTFQNLDALLVTEFYGLVYNLLKLKELDSHKRFNMYNMKLCFSKKGELKIPPKDLVGKITVSHEEQLYINECGKYTRDVYELLKQVYITIACLYVTDEFVTSTYEDKHRKLTLGNFNGLCWPIKSGVSNPSGELVTKEQLVKLVPLIQELRA